MIPPRREPLGPSCLLLARAQLRERALQRARRDAWEARHAAARRDPDIWRSSAYSAVRKRQLPLETVALAGSYL